MNFVDNYGDSSGLCALARKWLNRASVSRTISRQETTYLLSGLPLTLCSERIEAVSTSRHQQDNLTACEGSNSSLSNCKSWMHLYEVREGKEDENFSDFIFRKMNEASIDGKVKKNISVDHCNYSTFL